MTFRVTEDIEDAKQFVGEEGANENETAVHHNEGFAKNKNEKNARIIPSDVEKEVSLQIEREFDDAVKELGELLPSEESEDFGSLLNKKIREYSKKETKELEEEYEQKISGLLSTLGLDRGETGQAELGDNKKLMDARITGPEREELWRQSDVLDRKKDFHRAYGKKLWYSQQPNVNYTIEDIEKRLSEIDTDSIPEIDYRLLASKRSSTLRTLMQKLKNFLTRLMRLPKG